MPILLFSSVSEHGAILAQNRAILNPKNIAIRDSIGGQCAVSKFWQPMFEGETAELWSEQDEQSRRRLDHARWTAMCRHLRGGSAPGCIARRRQRTSQRGTLDQWGEQAQGVKEDANAMGMLIKQLGASPEKAKRPHRSNTFSKEGRNVVFVCT